MTDWRAHFATPEVAHSSLRGKIDAPCFSDGTRHRVATPTAGLYCAADARGLERQVLYGHAVTILPTRGLRAFGKAETMGHVGYLDRATLAPWLAPTHRVSARATLLFMAPDFKHPDPLVLSLGSHVTVTDTQGRYARLHDGRFAIASHLTPLDQPEPDPVAVAERLLGTPYLWGGNSAIGIDCSGLVQIALAACATRCPGDSDQQALALGTTLPTGTSPQRGDLMFWKGHVAWVADAHTLLHANAHHMAVAYEPIADALSRIKAQGDGDMTRHARL